MKRLALLVALIVATGCTRSEQPTDRAALRCSASATALVQQPPRDIPTTDGHQFLRGLGGQIDAAVELYENDPASLTKRLMLASLLGTRGKLFGDLDEIQRAIDLLADADDADALIERASLQQTLHRFPAARSDLAAARARGASPAAIAAIEAELDWNDGNYPRAIAYFNNPPRRTMMSVLRQARLAHDLGDPLTADRLFAEAELLIDDTSPVPVAFLNFQRGFHAFELGRLDEAIVFYRAALKHLPGWITAQEHLAEVLALRGQTDEALALYEDVVSRSRDPELAGALSDLYRQLGRTAEADAMLARARAGFDAYAARFPEAAYGHGSEFFLGSGNDPARALSMREANVLLRPNGAAHAALADARLQLGDVAGARAAIERALTTPLRSATIDWTAARVYAALGDHDRARALAARACATNPRSSIDEPPIAL